MKNKYLRHTISFLLAFVLFLGCQWFAFSLSKLTANTEERLGYDPEPAVSARASGYDPNLYLKENYATYYFSNLSNNFGYNLKGSCCYIALAMMLSYYDTYWDDKAILEQYEVNSRIISDQIITESESPGIRNDYGLIYDFKISNEDYYYNIVEKYSDEYFHLKLIQMGQEQFNYYKFDSSQPCSLTTTQTANLAKYYLYNHMRYTSEQVSILSPNSTGYRTVRDFTISMIKQGIPVFLLGRNATDTSGHAVVAYDYNEKTDMIYTHMGWHGSGTTKYSHYDFGLSYPNLNNAFALQFNNEHSHSENYRTGVGPKMVETCCPCELSIHPTHNEIVNNHISVKQICRTGTINRDFAELKLGSGNGMLIELDLNDWLAENNALPSAIKEIYLVIPGKIKGPNNLFFEDVFSYTSLNIVERSSYFNIDYITCVPKISSHNKVKLLVDTSSTTSQSYSAYGMYFRVNTI